MAKTNFEMVQEFNTVFEVERNEIPTVPSDQCMDLRLQLVWEEFNEVIDEIEADRIDLYKLAKELCDLLYVVYGMADTFGLPIDKVFREVHRSNMSKLTIDGKVLRREDGKVLKSDQYSPADVESVMRKFVAGKLTHQSIVDGLNGKTKKVNSVTELLEDLNKDD